MSSKNITARKGDKFPAARLDFTDLGKTIRVMTQSGAIITDVLEGLHVGVSPYVHGNEPRIAIALKSVAPHGYRDFGERMFELAPTAVVTVVTLAKTDA